MTVPAGFGREQEQSEVRETLAVLWRRRVLIGAVALGCAILFAVFSLLQAKQYTATSLVVIRPVIPPAAFSGSSSANGGPLGLEGSAESEARIAASSAVEDRVRDVLGIPSTENLDDVIEVSVGTDELLEFKATSDDPTAAAAYASAFAEEYLNYRRDVAEGALRELAGSLRERLDTLQTELARLEEEIITLTTRAATAGTERERIEANARIARLSSQRNDRLFQLQSVRTRYEDAAASLGRSTGGGEVVQRADVPEEPSAPRPRRDGILGLLLGLALGTGLAFLREHYDDRIEHVGQASTALQLPILGVVPISPVWRNPSEPHISALEDPGSATSQAYRGVRQKLAALGVPEDVGMIAVTSLGGSAGKTTTSANLGVLFASAGIRTVVVSADLRKPRLHTFFRQSAGRNGLVEVLGGRTAEPDTVGGSLSILASPTVAKNPSELLDSPRLRETLADLRQRYQVVILDCPPLVSGADALVLAGIADVTLLLMTESHARVRAVRRAVDELTAAGGAPVYGVITLADVRRASAYGYGYGYGYGYTDDPSTGGASSNGGVHEAPSSLDTPGGAMAAPQDQP